MAIWLIWAYFHQNRTILKIWPLYKRSMTFSYFVLYLENATSYGYHVIDFFTPNNERNNMTCITTRLKPFNFPMRGGSQYPQGSLCVLFLWYPWNCRVGKPWGIFLHRGDKNNRWSHAMSCLLPGYLGCHNKEAQGRRSWSKSFNYANYDFCEREIWGNHSWKFVILSITA